VYPRHTIIYYYYIIIAIIHIASICLFRFLQSLKKRIESLIDREYIMRDPENRKMYKYLA
jgi:hypothetical protein